MHMMMGDPEIAVIESRRGAEARLSLPSIEVTPS